MPISAAAALSQAPKAALTAWRSKAAAAIERIKATVVKKRNAGWGVGLGGSCSSLSSELLDDWTVVLQIEGRGQRTKERTWTKMARMTQRQVTISRTGAMGLSGRATIESPRFSGRTRASTVSTIGIQTHGMSVSTMPYRVPRRLGHSLNKSLHRQPLSSRLTYASSRPISVIRLYRTKSRCPSTSLSFARCFY